MRLFSTICFLFTLSVLPSLSQDIDLISMNKNAITTGDTTGSGKIKIQPEDPNTIPYETKRNFAEHFFSVPAKLWHLLWLPLGESVIWMEQNHIHQQVSLYTARSNPIVR